MASKIKITETTSKPKATFVRKSVFLKTGDSSFRFNFNLEPEKLDSGPVIDNVNCINQNNTSANEETCNKENSNEPLKKIEFTSGSAFRFNFDVEK